MHAAHKEEALVRYDENWNLFVNQLRDFALFMLDPSGHVVTWNAGAERLKAYTAEEIVGHHFSIFYTAEDIAHGKPQAALDIASRKGTYHEEGLRVRKDGSRFWAMVNLTALRDKNGCLQGFAKLTQDISERRANEAALQESESKYRALFEHGNDAILLTRLDGAILSANPAACKLFGYSEQELIAFGRESLLDRTDTRLAAALKEQAETGQAAAELTFIRKGGERFEARVASKVFKDEMGRPLSSFIIHDITERKQAERALRQSEERFRLLYENAPLGIAHIDLHGYWTYANRKFAEIIGYSQEEVVGLSYIDVTPPGERDISRDLTEKLLAGKIEINRERRMLRRDGSTTWIRLTAKMLRDESGRPQYGIALFEDITERKRAEEALRQSEERFRATFEQAPLGVAECNLEGKFITANPKWFDMLGYPPEELEHLWITDITHPSDIDETFSNIKRLVAGEINVYVLEKRYVRKDRSLVWVNVTTSLRRIEGQPQYIIAMVEDVTARKKAEEDLRRALEQSYHLANHDTLTGLANRASFNDRLKDALLYAKRDGHLVALHFLDLDRFKSINDTLGHDIGDLLLKEVARRIKSYIRATDLAARLGGDEFVIIQTHLSDPAAAEVLAEKIVEEIGRAYLLEAQEIHSGTSIGIALYPKDAEHPEHLIKCADLALYEAKNRGRHNCQSYREEMAVAVKEAQRLEQELQRALHESELCLYYQPQFSLDSGRITGIEALLRWQHPEKGLLAAAEFIEDAKSATLIPPIEEWALRTACRQYKEWADAGLAVPLTVNVSSRQLRHPRFLQMLRNTLEETRLPPSALQLEMRESVLWDPRFPTSLLSDIKSSGFLLALDDFGSELTALSSLHKFPLDVIKPSQDLVKDLSSRKRETTIMEAIIGVAHDRGIAVCAEGIETADQLATVRGHGCDSAQGYLLSSPLTADEMKRLIEMELSH